MENSKRIEHCEKHNLDYEPKEICKVMGNPIYSKCPKCQEAIDLAIKRENEKAVFEAQEALRAQRERSLLNAGVSERYLSEGFKETEFSRTHHKYLDFENGDFKVKNNLIILGGCGIGKSFFCFRMVEIALKLKKKFLFIKAKDLRDRYKQSRFDGFLKYNSMVNIEGILRDLDCIIIDEIDDTFDDLEFFKQVVSFCYDKMIRLIVAGNCDPTTFKNKVEEKTYSRLAGSSLFKGNDFRDLRQEKEA